MTVKTWGASGAQWAAFSAYLGTPRDMLPVVADPTAPISERSKMRSLGKTPSQYNRDRKVVGMPDWTKHESSELQVKRWALDSDLGICVQTKHLRAIDVDIGDDATAAAVLDTIQNFLLAEGLAYDPPRRARGNSAKFLLPVFLDGTFPKRVIRTEHGMIEFLGDGQQCLLLSTHPTGVRYAWAGQGLALVDGEQVPRPGASPTLTPAQFGSLWNTLRDAFALDKDASDEGRLGPRPVRPRSASDVDDEFLDYLDTKGWVTAYQADGRVDVRCPWEDGHSTDSGTSSTTYFPRGVGGFMQGHWRCLHASCAHRGDADFIEATGWGANGFPLMLTQAQFELMELTDGIPEGVEVEILDNAEADVIDNPLPAFQRDGRTGKIKATLNNLIMGLLDIRVARWYLGHDGFTDDVMHAPTTMIDGVPVDIPVHDRQWVTFTDAARVELRLRLENYGFEPVAKENMRDALAAVAKRNEFDSAIEWLTHRVPHWDGVPRIDSFFSRYFHAAQTEYVVATSAYVWTALAGRVLKPGCKADMVPLLIGEGGSGKTTGVAAMAPFEGAFSEISLEHRDDDLARRLRGVLVGELGELRGLAGREREAILSWISRTHEEWTPKFKEFKTKFPRRCVFIGTTNRHQALVDDEAGLRRWLPIHVGTTDLAAINRDRDQMWAEARERFLKNGVEFAKADKLARKARGEATEEDAWLEPVLNWLLASDLSDDDDGVLTARWEREVTHSDISMGALGMPAQKMGRSDQMRVASVMRELGFSRERSTVEGRRGRFFKVICPTSFNVRFLPSDADSDLA
jgi:hypothetical protein